jgi:hypothetical protein
LTQRAIALAGASVAAAALAAVLAPLWTYAVSLALFGLPHVLVELRYVDERFGARLPGRTVATLVAVLLAVAGLRMAGLAGLGDHAVRVSLELGLGVGLAALVVPILARRSAGAALLGAGLAAITAVGALWAPAATLVVFALLHNLSPVAFLAERLRGRARTSALLAAGLVFGILPLWIVSGGAVDLLAGLGPTLGGPPRVGPLALHLGAFVPAGLQADRLGLDLFRAAAFLQCMHYAVVLHVLPRLGGGGETAGARWAWPEPRSLRRVVAALAVLTALGFAWSFGATRAVYGVFAAVHAWVEIPVLLAAIALQPVRVEVG